MAEKSNNEELAEHQPPSAIHEPNVKFALQLNASLGGYPIALSAGILDYPQGSPPALTLAGKCSNPGSPSLLTDWLTRIIPDVRFPDFFDFALSIEHFTIVLQPGSRLVDARLGITPFGEMSAYLHGDNFSFSIPPKGCSPIFSLLLSTLPLVGNVLSETDLLELQRISIDAGNQRLQFQVAVGVALGGSRKDFDVAFTKDFGADSNNGKALLLNSAAPENTESSPSPNTPQVFWVDARKSLGIFSLRKIGLEMGASSVTLYLDAGITLGPISVDFYELAIGVPLDDIKNFRVGLSGLALSLEKPPLSLSGGLYHDKDQDMQDMYTGEIVVGFTKFQLTALASYGIMADGTHSMFAYLVLLADLGGPPFLFITGVAGGFGLNRRLVLPEKVEDVAEFPFVQAAMGGKAGTPLPVKPAEMLSVLGGRVLPKKDAYFASIGLRFTTFGLLDSFVLLNIEFGNKFMISALGLSTLSIPPQTKNKDMLIAYACLAIKATFSPDDGILAIMGVLSNDSFVLDKNCKLTGGFAVYAWTSGEHAGDFTITFGGYHPNFKRPDHYPVVPPLGISWNITNDLSLRGSIYFALTPSAVMAGGQLSITYQKGNLSAWLTAYAHFLMEWKPFHYDIQIGVCVGVSYKIAFLFIRATLSIELSAQLHIWGPEFSGTARIKVFFISFTISFGENATTPPALTWEQFHTDFLDNGALCDIQAAAGISGEIKNDKGETLQYLIKPAEFRLRLTSRLPLGGVTLSGHSLATGPEKKFGIKPMRLTSVKVTLVVTVDVTPDGGLNPVTPDPTIQWAPPECLVEKAPSALWGEGGDPLSGKGLVEVLQGVDLRPKPTVPQNHLPCKNQKDISYALATLTANQVVTGGQWAWGATKYPERNGVDSEESGLIQVQNTICDPDIMKKRADIARLCSLQRCPEPDPTWSERPQTLLFATPTCCPTGYRPKNKDVA